MGGHDLVRRDAAERRVAATSTAITWFTPSAPADAEVLARWREGVGPPVIRARVSSQARGLRDALQADTPLVLGGDFNTWFGFADQAYVETSRAFPGTRVSDRRPTFHGLLRLDHIFFRLPAGWLAEFHRADDRFGSDHHPLVGTVRFR